MPRKSKPSADEPLYKKWTAVAGVVVAAVSLLSNVILGVSTYRLSQSKNEMEKELNGLKLENERLDGLVKTRNTSVDLETRYLVVTGLAIFEIEASDLGTPGGPPAIVQNQVLEQLQPWKERWEAGESPVVKENGTEIEHGIVLLHVSNRGKENAQRVVLTVRHKDFPAQGQDAESLWELKPVAWQESTIRLADLQVGQSINVPLAHTLGTNMYFGWVILPAKLEWFNPTLQKQESMPVAGMAPEEQWISRGTKIRIAQ